MELLPSVRKHGDRGKKDKGREGVGTGGERKGGRDPHLAIWKLG